MEDTTTPTVAEVRADLPSPRPCTRCDGQQHLLAERFGLGKYRCDGCELVVGFDLETPRPEFLIDRGLPSRYTKDVFGDQLLPQERRLEPRTPQLAGHEAS